MEESLGFIGLGLMGEAMAMRLLESGRKLFVHNRTKQKADPLLAAGAQWCRTPAEVAQRTTITLTMLSNSEALEIVSVGSNGILSGAQVGSIHIDHSTVSPELTQRLASKYKAAGYSFLHAPVLGSIPQASDGSLLLFLGGDEEAFLRVKRHLEVLGKKIWRFKNVEEATHTKLLCNFFIAGMITTLTQALVYAKKSGIHSKTLLEIIGQSSLNAPMYQTKGASIIARNFAPRFFIEHMLKDIQLLVDASGSLAVSMPTAEIAHALFTQAVDAGLAKEDYSAVVKILERIANVEVD